MPQPRVFVYEGGVKSLEKFTQTEIRWIAMEMKTLSRELHTLALESANVGIVPKILQLRSEQYADIAKRLKNVLEKGSKHIEII